MEPHSSSGIESDDETPLHLFKQPKKKKPPQNYTYCNKKDLYKFRQEKCEFCEELLFCWYDVLVHNAKHIIIPLKDELVQCKECNKHFASNMDYEIHTKINHFEVPDILKSLLTSKPVIRCDSSVNELVIQNNERKLGKILNKNAVVECDSIVTDLIEEKKNTETLKGFVIKQPVIKCEDTIKSMLSDKKEMKAKKELKAIRELETSRELEEKKELEEIRELETSRELEEKKELEEIRELEAENEYDDKLTIDLLTSIPKVVINKHDLLQNNVDDIKCQDIFEEDVMLPESNIVNGNGTSNIKNRLIFEDDESDFEDDIISTNVNCFIIGDMMTENEDVCDLTLDDSDDDIKDEEIVDNIVANGTSSSKENSVPPIEESAVKSVHYEDLIDSSLWQCERCNLTFSNRYDLIIHETDKHFQIKQRSIFRSMKVCPICDRYIAGTHWSLKLHIKRKHPDMVDEDRSARNFKICQKCNLRYYSLTRHTLHYHFMYRCRLCPKRFEMDFELTEHISSCKGKFDSACQQVDERIGIEKIIKVCELCSLFFKNTQIFKYVPIKDYSEHGRRITCERCEKQFFEVKLIKLINKHPIAQPCYKYHRKTSIPSTNENRLKNIQKRLKLMNKRFR